ncbi:putative MFS monocarboxylate transporter (Mct) [Aspergillus saccharolyticus JOP 1030-1]|uniref:MFS general substrate transporter n=1 Tax=Aspergillus saccharolyticus JOP 1030-1 TaxID=1450539 RepID=A0A319A419_9EURO|nr:MFS general substrate transporter [Aspergillus saccharolyticus JOP 1030-1]PYH46868.1 MFS general substrate transporter [Aspergillus saccharolyticus JOP 1030-1]
MANSMHRQEFDLPSELPAEDINELYHSHDSTSTTQFDAEPGKEEPVGGRQPTGMKPEGGRDTNDAVEKIGAAAVTTQLARGPEGAPDGGMKAWLTVLGGFCGMFVSFGWVNCMGIFIDYYKTHQLKDESTSTVTWVTSLMTFMMFFGGPFVGILFDNFGPRYIMLAGTFFHVFGLMMISISSEYYQFLLAQGICSPIGTSALFHCSINSISTWFGRRRALALGIATSGASLGGVVLPIMLTRLFELLDFGWAVRICAFLILFCLILANCTLRSRLHHRRKPFHLIAFIRPLREIPFLLTTAGTFCFFWGMFLPFSFIPSQAQKNGMSASLASYLIPIMNAASTPGRIIPPYLADLFGRFNLMILMTLLSVILVLALWLPTHGNVPSILFSAFYGFGSGTAVSLAPALVAQISEIQEIGVRSGTYFFIVSFAALTGTPIAGALLPDPLHGSYLKLNVFCAVVMFSGVGFYCAAKLWISGGRVWNKV